MSSTISTHDYRTPPLVGTTAGSILRARYVLEQMIGKGGDSIVFRARDVHRASPEAPDSFVAIKVLLPTQQGNPHALTRLKREFWQMQRLTHPGIVRVFDLDCDGDIWFISMELVAGQTVGMWMQKPVRHAEAVRVVGACCEALDHAHSLGILHGDLKSTNVLLSNDGTVKLIDFGSAASPGGRVDAASDPSLAATSSYASPQVLAGEPADQRDDVFSLACLSYGIFSGGGHPFGHRSSLEAYRAQMVPAYAPAIPIRLFEVVARGLARERTRRPASAREFLRELMGSDLSRGTVTALDTPTDAPTDVASNAASTAAGDEASDGADEATAVMPVTVELVKLVKHRSVLAAICDWFAGSGSYWRAERRWGLIGLTVMTLGAAILIRQVAQQSAADPRALPRPVPAAAPGLVARAAAEIPVQPDSAAAATPELGEPAPPVPRQAGIITFEEPAVFAVAAQPFVAIPIRREHSTRGTAVVAWRVESGTAQPGVDYDPAGAHIVRFIEGQRVSSLFIPLIHSSATAASRGPRTFSVTLKRLAGGPALGPVGRVNVTIAPALEADSSEP